MGRYGRFLNLEVLQRSLKRGETPTLPRLRSVGYCIFSMVEQYPNTKIDMNPWTYKPWWCQPWSILLTGIALIGSSWLLWKTIWVTVLISLPVLTWMGFFLIIWPQLMRDSSIPLSSQYLQSTPDSVEE